MNELEQFKNFLVSDLYLKGTRKKDAIRLFDLIMSYYPECNTTALDKTKVVEILIGDKNINRLEKIMSDLLNALEEFLHRFISHYQLIRIEKQLNIAQFYRVRGRPKRSEIYLKEVADFWNELPTLSNDLFHLYPRYIKECEENQHLSFLKKSKLDNSIFTSTSKVFHFIIQARLFCYKIYTSTKKLSEFDVIELRFLEEVERCNSELKSNLLFQLYLLSSQLFEHIPTEEILNTPYFTFNKLLNEHINSIDLELLQEFLVFERIFFTLRYNVNQNIHTANGVRNIYLEHLNNGYLLSNGIMSPSIAINLLYMSIKQNDAQWIFDFLTNWGDVIGNPEDRTETLNYFWSIYHFLIEDYEKASALVNYEFSNVEYVLPAKRMNIKILYETKNEHLLEYDLNAFKIYVHRIYKKEDILVTIFDFNNNFINLLKQIINLGKKNTINAAKKELLKTKILETKAAEKEWLLEKVEALGNNI